jgi:hypothetical protein
VDRIKRLDGHVGLVRSGRQRRHAVTGRQFVLKGQHLPKPTDSLLSGFNLALAASYLGQVGGGGIQIEQPGPHDIRLYQRAQPEVNGPRRQRWLRFVGLGQAGERGHGHGFAEHTLYQILLTSISIFNAGYGQQRDLSYHRRRKSFYESFFVNKVYFCRRQRSTKKVS